MPEDEAENSEEAPKKGLPLVPIIAVGAVLLIEAVLIVGLFMFSGGPEAATANPGEPDEMAEMQMPAEIMVARGKFQNTSSCLLYTSPSPRDRQKSRMPSSA